MTDADTLRHDFNNQLTIIRGFTELLLTDTPPGDPRRRDLEDILTAATSALDLLVRIFPAGVRAP